MLESRNSGLALVDFSSSRLVGRSGLLGCKGVGSSRTRDLNIYFSTIEGMLLLNWKTRRHAASHRYPYPRNFYVY